jgi:DUF1680 family protein
VNGYAYSKAADAIWINFYGGSVLSTQLNGAPLQLTQHTNYPWDGHVQITFNECSSKEFTLKVRIPGWAETAAIFVNDERPDVKAVPATYAEIRRRWRPGDVVRLDLAMLPQLIEAHPLVEETLNQVAIKRGPIVYCLESCDLPKDVRVHDLRIPADSKLSAQYDGRLLSGVAVIEGTVLAKRTTSWESSLYRPLRVDGEREFKARFIPYFAWANRTPSDMTVWLPLK